MSSMRDEREEMQNIASRERIHVALSSYVPQAAENEIWGGGEVLIYMEKPISKWIGAVNFHVNKLQYVVSEHRGQDVEWSTSINKVNKNNQNGEKTVNDAETGVGAAVSDDDAYSSA